MLPCTYIIGIRAALDTRLARPRCTLTPCRTRTERRLQKFIGAYVGWVLANPESKEWYPSPQASREGFGEWCLLEDGNAGDGKSDVAALIHDNPVIFKLYWLATKHALGAPPKFEGGGHLAYNSCTRHQLGTKTTNFVSSGAHACPARTAIHAASNHTQIIL
jgi:hypothetical protein